MIISETITPVSVYLKTYSSVNFIVLLDCRWFMRNGKFFVNYKGKFYLVQSRNYEPYIIVEQEKNRKGKKWKWKKNISRKK